MNQNAERAKADELCYFPKLREDLLARLSERERKFSEEARKGHFLVELPPEADQITACGATGTANLFSMPVIETRDRKGGGSFYTLPDEDEA